MRPRRPRLRPSLAFACLCGLGAGAANPAAAADPPAAADQGNPDFFTGFWRRSTLLGDAGGVRPALATVGLSFGLQETSEVFGNLSGGVHRGAAYDGLTLISLGLDTKALGWDGGTFNISAFQIHGRNLSADNLATLQTASGIEANRATRLWELWYQQSFLEGKFDIKIGQQSLDQEFLSSQGSSLFINTSMGWPLVPSVDQYAGGPAYPLSSLGVRLRAQPTGNLTLLGGVFDDNPPGGPFSNDSQLRGAERSGTKFHLGTGALFIAEAQYALNQPAAGDIDNGQKPAGLPGTYKLGFWYDTGSFPDPRIDTTGLSLADPNSSGIALLRHGNYSLYAVIDQTVWRPDPDGVRAVSIFVRPMLAPGDRNLADFSVNAGVTLKAPLPGRDNDTLGIGYGLANISGHARRFDGDTAFFSGANYPVRSSESFIELTYQYQIVPWWTLQPDAQYVFNPSGGIPNPNGPTKRISNEAILGLRTVITF